MQGVAQGAEGDAVKLGEELLGVSFFELGESIENGGGGGAPRRRRWGCGFVSLGRLGSEMEAAGGEVGQGGEGLGGGVSRFEGLEVYPNRVGFALDVKKQIDTGRDDAGAAEDAGLVVVVQDEDGGVGGLGQVAHAQDEGLQDEDRVLVTAAHDISQGIDDDEAGVDGLGGLHEALAFVGIAQIEVGQGHVMERRFGRGVVGLERGMDARPEARLASLFINEEDGALVDGAAEPGLAGGEANGQVEGEEGLLGTGIADENVERAAGEEAFDAPVLGGRRLEGIGGVENEAVVEKTILAGREGGENELANRVAFGMGVGERVEGVHALDAGSGDGGNRGEGGSPGGRPVRLGRGRDTVGGAVFYEASDGGWRVGWCGSGQMNPLVIFDR